MVLITKASLGFLSGLSVGVYCLGLCLPVFLPILLSQKRTAKSSFLVLIEFSFGRLLGYLFFGIVFGLIGELVQSDLVHYLAAIGNIWIGILMILYSLGNIDKKFCSIIILSKIKWPFLLGLLTGINVCPPFLGSLTYVFNLRDVFASLIYFFMFFLGTTTYIVPSAFLGIFTKVKFLPKLAQVSGVIVGIYFVLQSITKVW